MIIARWPFVVEWPLINLKADKGYILLTYEEYSELAIRWDTLEDNIKNMESFAKRHYPEDSMLNWCLRYIKYLSKHL